MPENNNNKQVFAILEIFKGFIGEKSDKFDPEGLKYGLLIPDTASKEVIEEAIKMYGIDGALWNQTFHKSWDKVADAPMMQLVIEQLMHYITTYGYEEMGCYSDSTIYIPAEELEIPELDVEKIQLTPIKAFTEEEVSEKLMELLTSGIALSKKTINNIQEISDFVDKDRFDEVKNKEVKTFLYDKYNIVPKDPEEFLRYLIFKVTKSTLKIQSLRVFRSMKDSALQKAPMTLSLLNAYGDFERLSSIFLRNKNFFLGLKTSEETMKEYLKCFKINGIVRKECYELAIQEIHAQKEVNKIVNKLRKLAQKNHIAQKAQYLDTLTSLEVVDEDKLKAALEKVTIFRAIRILNALAFRKTECEDILYRIRNGKSYVKKIEEPTEANKNAMEKAYQIVYDYVLSKISEKVKDKTVYIPEGITYKMPSSEKQFIGNIPQGSYFELPKDDDLTFAVHWLNIDNPNGSDENLDGTYSELVDLDLHVMNENSHFGWNAAYRDGKKEILYSGDMTSAPLPYGATEAFSLSKNCENSNYIVNLNCFTANSQPIPYEFILATGKIRKQNSGRSKPKPSDKYIVDPNLIKFKFNMVVEQDKRQQTLGTIEFSEEHNRYYFESFAVGASQAISHQDEVTMGAKNYMLNANAVQVSFNEMLAKAGAKVVNDKNESIDIDLSPEVIDKTTFINLL